MSGQGCSCVAITDEALVAEVNRYPNPSSLSSSRLLDLGSQLLRMLLQDGSLVEFAGSVAKDLSGRELVVRGEEPEIFEDLEPDCVLEEEDLLSLPSKFVNVEYNVFIVYNISFIS